MNKKHTVSSSTAHGKQQQPRDTSRDNAGFTWSTVIKITDPKTGQILLHTRGE